MRTVLVWSLVGGLAIATGAAAGPRGLPSYPICAANFATTSLGAFPGGDVVIDTTAGTVNGAPVGGVLLGNETRVLVFDSIAIASGDTVRVTGGPALALLSLTEVAIGGALVADGANSPDGDFEPVPVPGGPGGGAGGLATSGGTGGGAGGGAQSTNPTASAFGGGGGGFGGAGGSGGGTGTQPGAGGGTYGDLTVALEGGSGGGAGTGPESPLVLQTTGGGGGGGLFLGSLGAIQVAATGAVTADGGHGDSSSSGASAGGSGGGIVLYGRSVANDGTVTALGGDGGSGGCCGGGGGGGGGRILVASASIAGGGFSVAGGTEGSSGSGVAAVVGTGGVLQLENAVFDVCSATQPFVCYKAKPTRGGAPFAPLDEDIVDELQSGATRIAKPAALCTPGGFNTIAFDEDHFESYAIKPDAKHEKRTGVPVVTPFGTLSVDTVMADRLLLPAAVSTTAAPPALPFAHFDSFRCYKAKLSKGSPKLAKDLTAVVQDPFSAGNRTLRIKKLSRLCVPASRNGAPIADSERILACFAAAPAKGEPKHVKRSGVFATQAFGTEQLDTLKEEEYCAPATFGAV